MSSAQAHRLFIKRACGSERRQQCKFGSWPRTGRTYSQCHSEPPRGQRDDRNGSTGTPSSDSATYALCCLRVSCITYQRSRDAEMRYRRLVIPPGTFSTHVYIDHRERVISQALVASLSRQGISCEVAALTLGDYLWTARRRVPTGDGCKNEMPRRLAS